jgi:hypothetical protein
LILLCIYSIFVTFSACIYRMPVTVLKCSRPLWTSTSTQLDLLGNSFLPRASSNLLSKVPGFFNESLTLKMYLREALSHQVRHKHKGVVQYLRGAAQKDDCFFGLIYKQERFRKTIVITKDHRNNLYDIKPRAEHFVAYTSGSRLNLSTPHHF